MRAAAPHIAHGLKAAQLTQHAQVGSDEFVPHAGWGCGIVLMDSGGKLIAMDEEARLLFQQLGVFDGLSANSFSCKPLRAALDYVTDTLRKIFHEPDGGSFFSGTPVYSLYHHRTGIVLRLRGVRMPGVEGRDYTTVLIERGETAESRQRRLHVRWGLSRREAEVLALIAEGKTGPGISILLRISHDTVRKHTSRILEKLSVETRTAAAAVARELALNIGTHQ